MKAEVQGLAAKSEITSHCSIICRWSVRTPLACVPEPRPPVLLFAAYERRCGWRGLAAEWVKWKGRRPVVENTLAVGYWKTPKHGVHGRLG
jgi:hypothetical protein